MVIREHKWQGLLRDKKVYCTWPWNWKMHDHVHVVEWIFSSCDVRWRAEKNSREDFSVVDSSHCCWSWAWWTPVGSPLPPDWSPDHQTPGCPAGLYRKYSSPVQKHKISIVSLNFPISLDPFFTQKPKFKVSLKILFQNISEAGSFVLEARRFCWRSRGQSQRVRAWVWSTE